MDSRCEVAFTLFPQSSDLSFWPHISSAVLPENQRIRDPPESASKVAYKWTMMTQKQLFSECTGKGADSLLAERAVW